MSNSSKNSPRQGPGLGLSLSHDSRHIRPVYIQTLGGQAIGPADAQRLSPGDRAIIELPDGRTIDARVRAVIERWGLRWPNDA